MLQNPADILNPGVIGNVPGNAIHDTENAAHKVGGFLHGLLNQVGHELTPSWIPGIGGGGKAKAPSAPTQPTDTIVQLPQQESITSLLSSLLGQSQGQVPQGYANFFSQVLGPMQAQLGQAFQNQLGQVHGASPSVLGDLTAMNQAQMAESGPAAQGLQNFVLGPIANTQKQMQSLQAALAYVPYLQASSGTISPIVQAILQQFGAAAPGTTAAGVTAPAGAAAASGTPAAPNLTGQ
jgi:hypothetical protein